MAAVTKQRHLRITSVTVHCFTNSSASYKLKRYSFFTHVLSASSHILRNVHRRSVTSFKSAEPMRATSVQLHASGRAGSRDGPFPAHRRVCGLSPAACFSCQLHAFTSRDIGTMDDEIGKLN
ncbi:hypothetical protein EVAR_76036_1 [Eumeta japonica]|uniref:Uncharacterized protein n=1 Tax=Eumeta variegata TaxID=151549 RepID=A0A4C1UAB9_EUMVA|nr:hypothetical protein EVAR_76036_1 [Eumeta japonica]